MDVTADVYSSVLDVTADITADVYSSVADVYSSVAGVARPDANVERIV